MHGQGAQSLVELENEHETEFVKVLTHLMVTIVMEMMWKQNHVPSDHV